MNKEEQTLTLAQLLGSISEVIGEVYAGNHWVEAELAAAHAKSKGYWILELQQSDDSGRKLAQTQAMVWANNVPFVIYKFEKATGQKLSAGMKVRVRAQVGFHPQWGFRLTVDDIDTSWTLGEAQANNKKIRQLLEKEGVWNNNKLLPTPKDFLSVAIIAPDTSAGLDDFLKETIVLEEYNLAKFDLINAPFEGANANSGIPNAFKKILQSKKEYDAICIVRGGGAASGIAWLNQENIIRAVATCPIPVICGIGHERDTTLVDEVSNVVCGTPSKAIGYITSIIIGNAQDALKNWTSFQNELSQRITLAHQKIDEDINNIKLLSDNLIKSSKQDIEVLLREAIGLGPQATLKRGYALIQDESGQIIKTSSQALEKDRLKIMFEDNSVNVIVDKDK